MDEIKVIACAECCVRFGITEDLIAYRKKTGKAFYCPNGHGNVWPAASPDKKIAELEAKVRDLEKQLGDASDQVASLVAELEIWKPSEPK